jgi:hypothetical protein
MAEFDRVQEKTLHRNDSKKGNKHVLQNIYNTSRSHTNLKFN